MRNSLFLAAILVGLPALAVPALAHHDEPHPVQMAQIDRMAQEMRRAPGATPYVPEQNRGAAQAEASGIDDAPGLLRAAQTALRTGRRGQAIEFMERAESRLLTRSTPALRAGVPVDAGPVAGIAAARRAAAAGDTATALREIDAALVGMDRQAPRRGT